MKKNMIEKYYMEDGQQKFIMDQNTARDVKIAIDYFEAGLAKSSYSEVSQIRLTAKAIAEGFLPEGTVIGDYAAFLNAVRKTSNDLLGIKEESK